MAKVKTHEEAVAEVEATKEALKEAKTQLRNFKAENGIKRDVVPEDAKVKKQLEKLEAAVEKAQTAADAAKEAEKELRPAKERKTTYEYPAECTTAADKKKFRAKARREKKSEAKKAEKAEKGESPKAEKAEAKGDAKPAKKVIKKKPEASEED